MAEDVTWSPVPNDESAMGTSPLGPDADSHDEYNLGDLSDIGNTPDLPSCTGAWQQVNLPGSLTSTVSWSGPLPVSGDASNDSGSYDSTSETSETSGTSESSKYESGLPLHYSRKYRMTESYLNDNPLESEWIPYPPATADEDRLDPPGTIDIESSVRVVHESLGERLDVDKDTITYLAEIAALDKPMQLNLQLDVGHSVRKQRIELPIL